MYTTFLRAQDDDNYTYSAPEYAALSDAELTLVRETNIVVSDAEREADAIAREFQHSGSRVSTGRVTDDGYVSTEDAADAWLREQDRAAYAALDDSTAEVATDTSVWVDGELMNVVDLTLAYEKMMWRAQRDLNWWVQNDGTICIGSVRITYTSEGIPTAKCVKCNQSLMYSGNSEYDQQTFVLGCITHGHNHQAKGAWVEVERVERTLSADGVLTERPYKMRMFFERSRTPISAPIAERIHNAERDNYQRMLRKQAERQKELNDWLDELASGPQH